MGVIKFGDELSFVKDLVAYRRIRELWSRDHFNRDRPLQGHFDCLEDNRLSPRTNLPNYVIAIEGWHSSLFGTTTRPVP